MDAELLSFFQKHRAKDDGETYSHVLVNEPYGKCYVSQKDEETLFIHQQRISETNAVSYLAEKSHNSMPIIVDFDIKYDEDEINMERRYTADDLRKIVRIYFQVFRDLFVSFDEERLVCCVLEKKNLSLTDQGVVKDGFHLHFPFFVIEGHIQQTTLRKKAIELMKADKALTKTFKKPEAIIDENVPSIPWLMYGSRKSADKEPYLVTKVFNKDCNEVMFEQIFGDNFIARHLSIHWGVRQSGNHIALRPTELVMPVVERKLPSAFVPGGHVDVAEVLKDAKVLMHLFEKKRFEDRKSWFDIGACLYNIGNGSDMAYKLWVEFSKKAPGKFDEEVCHRMWEKDFKPNNRTLGSLVFYARSDNPESYERWRRGKLTPTIDLALEGTDFNVANLLHQMFKDEIVCVSASKNKWYRFHQHRWQLCDDGIDLEHKILYDLRPRIMERRTQLSQKAAQIARDNDDSDDDDNEIEKIEEKIKKCSALIKKLETDKHIKAVMRMAKTLFYQRDFMKKLDTNPDIVCFTNGVYDLESEEFRDGRPDDYITICTNNEYKELSWNAEVVKECMSFIKKTFVNPNERKYALQYLASCWRGKNINKTFMAWLGEPNTGKSTLNKEVQKAFGEYCSTFQTTTFTGKKPSGGAASPDWYKMKSCRLGTMQEPNGDEEINIGTLKELTGNDRFTARPLFGPPEDIEPQMKFYIMCNKVPSIPSNDPGTFLRLRILTFSSVFVDDPPESEEEQYRQRRFPKILNIDEKLDEFVPAFIWILLQEFKEYKANNYTIHEPLEVLRATNEFRARNDVMTQFANTYIVRSEDVNDKITFTEFHHLFRTWYKTAYPQSKQITLPDFRELLSSKFGKPDGKSNTWKYLKIVDPEEQDQEEDASAGVLGGSTAKMSFQEVKFPTKTAEVPQLSPPRRSPIPEHPITQPIVEAEYQDDGEVEEVENMEDTSDSKSVYSEASQCSHASQASKVSSKMIMSSVMKRLRPKTTQKEIVQQPKKVLPQLKSK
jgi:phage/plasmid-associated DNA primase